MSNYLSASSVEGATLVCLKEEEKKDEQNLIKRRTQKETINIFLNYTMFQYEPVTDFPLYYICVSVDDVQLCLFGLINSIRVHLFALHSPS